MGESSRSIHERALEHERDARSFSVKSHIVKHWMTTRPSLPSPPEIEFSVTGMFKDCLSRQISEALRINNSIDVLLNSKTEYGHNSVSRLTVQEDVWERKERDRQTEEQEKLNKQRVEEFKRWKSKPGDMHTVGGEQTGHYPGSHCTPEGQTEERIYETDDEEFEDGGQDVQPPSNGMQTAGGEQTGHYPGSHCSPQMGQ